MEHNDVVVIQLDRPYVLRFGNKALKEFSALTGTTMDSFDAALADFGKQQAAAYVLIKQDCVRQGLPAPNPAQVEDLLDEHVTPARLYYLLNKAAEAAFSDEELKAEVKRKQQELAEQRGGDPLLAAGTGGKA